MKLINTEQQKALTEWTGMNKGTMNIFYRVVRP